MVHSVHAVSPNVLVFHAHTMFITVRRISALGPFDNTGMERLEFMLPRIHADTAAALIDTYRETIQCFSDLASGRDVQPSSLQGLQPALPLVGLVIVVMPNTRA